MDELGNRHSGFCRSLEALNCQNTFQNACYGCEIRNAFFYDGRKFSEAVCKYD